MLGYLLVTKISHKKEKPLNYLLIFSPNKCAKLYTENILFRKLNLLWLHRKEETGNVIISGILKYAVRGASYQDGNSLYNEH